MAMLYTIIALILLFVGMSALRGHQHRRMKAQRSLDEKRVQEIIEADFKTLDVIAAEKRWIGAGSEIVCWRYPFQKANGFKQVLLCKSAKGSWFVTEYRLDGFEVVDVDVHQSDEATARSWIAPKRELYTKHFPLPETA